MRIGGLRNESIYDKVEVTQIDEMMCTCHLDGSAI